ncbi:MAG: ATP-binding protein [Bacteroidetes bacterium]|nr:ATP-binding protein [Bacteroidota bacterium]
MLWNNAEPARLFNEFSFHKVSLGFIDSFFVKDFLYKVYKREILTEGIEVNKILCLQSRDAICPREVKVEFNSSTGIYDILDNFLLFVVKYNNIEFDITYLCTISDTHMNDIHMEDLWSKSEALHIKSARETNINPKDVYDFIRKKSFETSFLKNSVLLYKSEERKEFDIRLLRKLNLNNKNTNEVFLPPQKQEHIERFAFAVKNYQKDKLYLRYLFNGSPGTGKTNIINNIIKQIEGLATVFILNGQMYNLAPIFYFCSSFEPCVLVFDDLDLIIGSREEKHNNQNLSCLLQYLDGFQQNNLFILSTTNIKELVDKAASRPGRFDLILDIAEIESENYLQLVERETNDEQIISFFTDNILAALELKKATGAFIVNLVKQLTSIKKMKGELANKDFEMCMDLTYRGFYSNNSEH